MVRNAMVMRHDVHMRGLPWGCMDVRVRVLVPSVSWRYHLHGVSSLLPLAPDVSSLTFHLLSRLLTFRKALAFKFSFVSTRPAARSSGLLASGTKHAGSGRTTADPTVRFRLRKAGRCRRRDHPVRHCLHGNR